MTNPLPLSLRLTSLAIDARQAVATAGAEARGLVGLGCHLASARLHKAAARLIVGNEPLPKCVVSRTNGSVAYHDPPLVSVDMRHVTLADVAPHIATARDTLRRKLRNACRRAVGRITGGEPF